MNKVLSGNKILLGLTLVFTTGSLLIEVFNDFRYFKNTYTFLNVDTFFKKDTLVNIKFSSHTNKGSTVGWTLEGDLLHYKRKNATMSVSQSVYGNQLSDTLMVWYCDFTNTMVKRDTDKMSKNPFSHYDSEAINSIIPFLFIPNFFWFLALYFPSRKKLFYGIIGAYFLLFIYGCITDFEIIKQHMDYFKYPKNGVSVMANATTSQIQLPDDYDPFWFVDYGTPRFDNHLKLMGERSLWQNIKHEWIIILTIIAWIVGTTLALKFKNKKNEK